MPIVSGAPLIPGVLVSIVRTHEIARRRLLTLLSEKGTKHKVLAEKIGRGPSWFSQFIRGRYPFPLEALEELATFYDTTPQAFFLPLSPSELQRSNEAIEKLTKKQRGKYRSAS